MNPISLQTKNLELTARSLDQVREQVAGMDAGLQAELSPEWLASLQAASAGADAVWVLGFQIVHRATQAVVGQCGFKGPPGADGTVEIAYMIEEEYQNKGFATEAAGALTGFALGGGEVRSVLAHTLRERNASTRVLDKCGFRHLGEVTDPEDGLVWRWEKQNDMH